MNLNELIELDNHGRYPNGEEPTYKERCAKIIEALGGLDAIISFIPFSLEQIKKALPEDEYLNNLPMEKWDQAAGFRCKYGEVTLIGGGIVNLYRKKGVDCFSVAEGVGILKNAAKLWAERGETKEMKKTFEFGKVDFEGKGKINLVTVDMEYKDKGDEKKVLSISGNVWNARKTDIVCGGQCLDRIVEYIDDPVFVEIYRLWKLYHLNDMHAECEHQHALGWHELAKEKVTLYHWTLTSDVLEKQCEIKKLALNALKSRASFEPTKEQTYIYSLPYQITTESDRLSEEQQKFYEPKKALYAGGTGHEETKRLGWLSEKKHSKGILSKPCPVCGYKYGSSWVYYPIPADDEKNILKLLEQQEEEKENEKYNIR